MTPDEIRDRFPQASDAFIRANATHGNAFDPALRPVKAAPLVMGHAAFVPHPAGLVAHARPLVKPRLRQKQGDGMNKTERAFFEHLKTTRHEMLDILPAQSITLKIANGCRYTPDFITVEHEPVEDAAGCAQTLCAYETKGHMRDDAAVKLKVAAATYPWIKFHLVTKAKVGRHETKWSIQKILP